MRIDSGVVEPFDFAAVGARQLTSGARVLEVRIQSPPGASHTNSITAVIMALANGSRARKPEGDNTVKGGASPDMLAMAGAPARAKTPVNDLDDDIPF